MSQPTTIEVERLALLEKPAFDALLDSLAGNGSHEFEHRTTIWYVNKDFNSYVKIDHIDGQQTATITKKDKSEGTRIEREMQISSDHITTADRLLSLTTSLDRYHSEQSRYSLQLKGIELVFKYTADVGYHIEFEQIVNKTEQIKTSMEQIEALAVELGVTLLTSQAEVELMRNLKDKRQPEPLDL